MAEQKQDIGKMILGQSHAAVRGRHAEVVEKGRQGAVFELFASI
jgi:hypothetical protein